MMSNDLSQIPVMEGPRNVKGIITWESIGSRKAMGQTGGDAKDYMEPAKVVEVKQALSNTGYDMVVAGEPEEALRLVAAEKPHLVLLDLVLPGSEGLELMQEIHQVFNVPVIF